MVLNLVFVLVKILKICAKAEEKIVFVLLSAIYKQALIIWKNS